MSGPKLSEYELAELRRQEEARRIAEMRKQEEARRREEKRLEFVKIIDEKAESVRLLRSQICEIKSYYDGASKICDISEVVALVNLLSDATDRALNFEKDYASTLEKATQTKDNISKAEERLKVELEKIVKIKEEWINQNAEVIRAEIGDLFKKDHSKKPKNNASSQDESDADMMEKAFVEESIDYLEQIASEWDVEPSIKADAEGIKKVLNNLSSLGDYKGAADYYRKKRNSFEKAIETLKAKHEELEEKFDKAKISYEAMCEIANVEPMGMDALTVSEESIRTLTEERIKIESEFLALREKQIVKEELDAVMDELGYDVVATKETTKKSGKIVSEKVYAFDEGCAIDFIEANGQLTMEVVGVDTSTREPSFEESVYLESEMESFCSLHKEIEEKLKQRGVVVKHRIQINPPSREYAQILNISEYEQKKEYVSMIQGIQRSKKKQTSATNYQTMN